MIWNEVIYPRGLFFSVEDKQRLTKERERQNQRRQEAPTFYFVM
jgi:hypothetical protein